MMDFKRVAKPQADLYDYGVLNQCDTRYQRYTEPAPRSFRLLNAIAVCPDRVAMFNSPSMLPVTNQEVGWEWVNEQGTYLSQWQIGAWSLAAYLDEFWAFKTEQGGMGCTSGHHVTTPALMVRAVYVSVNDLGGCAQGIYHEFAHLRLESLGIGIDMHDGRLLANAPDELYNSSVRFDVQRPMSAVLHGLYAWLMFTENDYWNRLKGLYTFDQWHGYSSRNWVKIENGLREVQQFARWTPDGAAFADGLFTWADDLLIRCRSLQ